MLYMVTFVHTARTMYCTTIRCSCAVQLMPPQDTRYVWAESKWRARVV